MQDPVFGPLVAFGPGGVFAELIGSTRLALAPLTEVDAAELVASGKAGRLVAGWRGAPPADTAALADVLHRLARLVEHHPEVAELDLNPVLAGPDGASRSTPAQTAHARAAPGRSRPGERGLLVASLTSDDTVTQIAAASGWQAQVLGRTSTWCSPGSVPPPPAGAKMVRTPSWTRACTFRMSVSGGS